MVQVWYIQVLHMDQKIYVCEFISVAFVLSKKKATQKEGKMTVLA